MTKKKKQINSIYETYKTDTKKEIEGVWLDMGPIRVKVARPGGANERFNVLFDRKVRKKKRQISSGVMKASDITKMTNDVFAETCVLDWETEVDGELVKGIPMPDGELVPVTVENIKAVFVALPDLAKDIIDDANELKLYQEEDAKN